MKSPVKNRVHLDVVVSVTQQRADVQAAADRVVAAGGQILRISDDPNDRFIVVGDPEGNEFCLVL
jgi:predicted enzyme related to lactoylglutathione lyase